MRNQLVEFARSNLRVGRARDVKLVGWMFVALSAGFLAYVARVHEVTHDVFHEMSLFREALVLGDFPQQEVFAYTDTVNPSVHHEWATGAILYFATIGSGLGLAGLAILKFSLIAALWLLLYRVARMRGANPYVFALTAVFCFPVFWVGFATVRAQLFTLVFLAAQLWMQEQDWRGRKAWIVLWLIMLVAWLNIHAGFVVGCGLIAFHSIERFGYLWYSKKSWLEALKGTWHLVAAAPIAVASLQINPYGWQYIPYLIRAIGMDRPLIREWLPLWHTHDPVGTLSLFAISLILFGVGVRAVWVRNLPRRRLRGAAFLVLTAYMTIKHIRHGSLFGVLWIAYVPAWVSQAGFGRVLEEFVQAHRQRCVQVCKFVTIACLAFASYHQFWRPTLPPQPLYSMASYPSDAINYLKQNRFSGNLMTPFHVGAYVSWEMYPQVRVSFDGRYEVAYQEHIMPEHNRFYDAEENWWEILDRYPTDAVLIHKQADVCDQLLSFDESDIAISQATRDAWQYVYEDDAFILLAKKESRLPKTDRRNRKIRDAAWEAFSSEHAHWQRNEQLTVAVK